MLGSVRLWLTGYGRWLSRVTHNNGLAVLHTTFWSSCIISAQKMLFIRQFMPWDFTLQEIGRFLMTFDGPSSCQGIDSYINWKSSKSLIFLISNVICFFDRQVIPVHQKSFVPFCRKKFWRIVPSLFVGICPSKFMTNKRFLGLPSVELILVEDLTVGRLFIVQYFLVGRSLGARLLRKENICTCEWFLLEFSPFSWGNLTTLSPCSHQHCRSPLLSCCCH